MPRRHSTQVATNIKSQVKGEQLQRLHQGSRGESMRVLLRLLPFVLLGSFLPAQIYTGSVVGTVRDTSGAVVPGATVHLVQVNTHLERTVKTDQTGDFVAVGMEPGEYTLRISANGFKTLERTGIVVPLGLRVPVPNLVLDVGGVSETVSVTAGGALVQ